MKVMFVSLGCDKNLVDTENMLGILNDRGFTFTDDEMEAEVIAVNTCCFIHDAKQESINTILEMAEHKKDGKCKILIVTGCLAHRYQDEITKEIPEVDAFIGTSSYDKIADVIEAVLDGRTYNSIEDTDRLPLVRSKRVVTTGGYYEYLKIAEGCDKHCTYCIIPKIRGNYRSYPMDYLVEQAEALVANGAKELILVAQETTVYGTDIYGKKALPELLHKLGQIEDLKWIRILYCYPEEINDELFVLILNGDVPRFLIHKFVEQRVHHFIEVLFHLLPADGAVNIENQQLILLNFEQNIQERFIPVVDVFPVLHRLPGILHHDPVHQVIDILKMVVKRHPVDTAVLGDIVDRDFIERLLNQQLFERSFQRPFCRLCHKTHPFPAVLRAGTACFTGKQQLP